MIPGSMAAMMMGIPVTPVDVQFISENYAASGTTATFTSQSIGAAASDRIVVVCVQCTNNTGSGYNGAATNISVTLGGNAMTRIVEAKVGNRNGGIFMLAVAAGTTATIVTQRGTNATHKISVYAVYGAAGLDDSAIANIPSSAAVDVSVDVEAGGGVVAMACQQGGGSFSFTWSGVNEDVDYNINAGDFTSGHADNLDAATPRTVTVTPSGNVGGWGVAAAASFR